MEETKRRSWAELCQDSDDDEEETSVVSSVPTSNPEWGSRSAKFPKFVGIHPNSPVSIFWEGDEVWIENRCQDDVEISLGYQGRGDKWVVNIAAESNRLLPMSHPSSEKMMPPCRLVNDTVAYSTGDDGPIVDTLLEGVTFHLSTDLDVIKRAAPPSTDIEDLSWVSPSSPITLCLLGAKIYAANRSSHNVVVYFHSGGPGKDYQRHQIKLNSGTERYLMVHNPGMRKYLPKSMASGRHHYIESEEEDLEEISTDNYYHLGLDSKAVMVIRSRRPSQPTVFASMYTQDFGEMQTAIANLVHRASTSGHYLSYHLRDKSTNRLLASHLPTYKGAKRLFIPVTEFGESGTLRECLDGLVLKFSISDHNLDYELLNKDDDVVASRRNQHRDDQR